MGMASSSSSSATQLPWSKYVDVMQHTPAPHGCFMSDYPNPAWVPAPCAPPPKATPTVGGSAYDEAAKAPSSTYIGIENGSLPSSSGITWESDTKYGLNSYSLQINSQTGFSCSWSNDCWEQFVYQNYGNSQGSYGSLTIWYVLIGYGSTCPSGGPTNGVNWYSDGYSCYSYVNPPTATPSFPLPTYISNIEFSASSDLGGSGVDQAVFCVKGTHCYAISNADTVMGLYNYWFAGEFNVLGLGSSSTAEFTPAAAITAHDLERTASGSTITPSCDQIKYTGEANNMSLDWCGTDSNTVVFTEANGYYLTMQVSGCCGSVSPNSGWYVAGASGDSITITATVSGCNTFLKWTGSGTGSYTGTTNPKTITMGSNITETASLTHYCAPTGG
jgi:hypothetical protein